MSDEKIAKTYAISLFSAIDGSENKERAIATKQSLETISQIWDDNKELAQIINNPAIPKDSKRELVLELLKIAEITDELVINFTKLIIQNKRFSLISLMTTHFNKILTDAMKGLSFEVVSAFTLDDAEKSALKESLVKNTGKSNLSINWSVNTDLIGGLQIKFGDKIFDTSLSAGLEKIQRDLLV